MELRYKIVQFTVQNLRYKIVDSHLFKVVFLFIHFAVLTVLSVQCTYVAFLIVFI